MNNAILTGVAALLVGGVGGYMAGSSGPVAQDTVKETGPPPSKGARTVIASSSSGTTRSSREMSFEEIMREPGKTHRLQSLMDFYADLDPAEFAAEAEKLDNLAMADRMLAGALLFSRWAEIAPEEAMAHAQDMGREGFFVRRTVVSSWASSDPVGAAQYYAANKDDLGGGGWGGRGGSSMNMAGQIAGEWAKQDPGAALEWAQELEGGDAGAAVQSVFRELAGSDPAKAAQMASSLDDEQQDDAYASIARQWASSDWTGAEKWISSLPADQRDAALSEAIDTLANDDYLLASQQVANLSDPDSIAGAVRDVVRSWSSDDPAAAANWLVSQSTEEMGRPMMDVMRNWVSDDQPAALAFLDAQPAGDLRDTAAATYLMANREGDVGESLQIAESIQGEEARNRAISVTAMRWAQEDKEAAAQYLEASPDFSEEQATRIIERAEGGGGRDGFGFGGRRGPGRGR